MLLEVRKVERVLEQRLQEIPCRDDADPRRRSSKPCISLNISLNECDYTSRRLRILVLLPDSYVRNLSHFGVSHHIEASKVSPLPEFPIKAFTTIYIGDRLYDSIARFIGISLMYSNICSFSCSQYGMNREVLVEKTNQLKHRLGVQSTNLDAHTAPKGTEDSDKQVGTKPAYTITVLPSSRDLSS